MGKASRTKRDRPPWSRDREMTALVSRLRDQEAVVEQQCPGALAELEQLRSRHRSEQADWAGWCWLPTRVSHQVAMRRSRPGLAEHVQLGLGEAMSFIGAWRQGKGIYRVSPEFAEQLHATRLPDALPGEVLLQFPEWCAYLALRPIAGVMGAYVRLDWDQDARRPVLALLFDFATEAEPEQSILVNLDLPLDHPSLSSALAELLADTDSVPGDQPDGVPALATTVRPFIDVALYLCSIEADVMSAPSRTAKPHRASSPSPEPRVWDVGYRVADLLRRASVNQRPQALGSHASPSPHMRRAHWHTYLVGKGSRADPSTARRELRWVHPTLVGAGDRVAVVRHLG